jgi:hypothetical protein
VFACPDSGRLAARLGDDKPRGAARWRGTWHGQQRIDGLPALCDLCDQTARGDAN